MAKAQVNLVVAVDQNGGIGKDGGLPWSLSRDWEHFLRLATRFVILLTMCYHISNMLILDIKLNRHFIYQFIHQCSSEYFCGIPNYM